MQRLTRSKPLLSHTLRLFSVLLVAALNAAAAEDTKPVPQNADAWLAIGELQTLRGRPDEAITSFSKAFGAGIDDPRVLP